MYGRCIYVYGQAQKRVYIYEVASELNSVWRDYVREIR